MIRSTLCLLVLVLAGCQTCKTPSFDRRPDTADPWNTNYLIDLDPETVSVSDLNARAVEVDQHYWDYCQNQGVIWPPSRTDPALVHPDRWYNGGDSGIFTGTALAAFAFEYGVTKSDQALDHVRKTLRGLYIVTHGSGTPGVIQRNSFPATQADKFGYPDEWKNRDPRFVHTGPALVDPFGGPQIPPQTYYTRGTKDQLTGIVLGLAAVWKIFDPAAVAPAHAAEAAKIREVAKLVSDDVYSHLMKYNWNIRDENGDNDTNADHVDDLLRCNVLALQVHSGNSALQAEYDHVFKRFVALKDVVGIGDRYNNYLQYFAHNLRASRSLTIWLLEGPGSEKGEVIAKYVGTNLWRFTRGHKNAWFAFIRGALTPSDTAAIEEGLYGLKSLSLKPLRQWSSPYFGQGQAPDLIEVTIGCHVNFVVDPHLRKPTDYNIWQKQPWDVGSGSDWDKEARADTTGLDFLQAYWLARYIGAL